MTMKVKGGFSYHFYSKEPVNINVFTTGENRQLYFEGYKDGEFYLNLPITRTYEIETEAKFVAKKPIEVLNIDIQLPEQDRNFEVKVNDFYISENDSPAIIYKEIGTICVSPSFMQLAIEQRIYILYHEVAHFFYSKEVDCDVFALKMFIEDNFNPSSAFLALNDVLKCNTISEVRNDRNNKRINKIYELISK